MIVMLLDSRLSFYILSCDKTMSKKEYNMLSYARRLEYNTDLIKVDQDDYF
jgi:hypothetical protein